MRAWLTLARAPWLRPLGLFWVALLLAAAAAAIALHALGPPATTPVQPPATGSETRPAGLAASTAPNSPVPPPAATKPMHAEARPGQATPGPIPAPEPAMLEPAADVPGGMLPRIAADGRVAMAVYAHGFAPPAAGLPRIGLLVAGVGLNAADSEDAIRALPGAVTLAVSPYAANTAKLLDLARATGHETLVSVPMEPQNYPMNDPGPEALLTGAPESANLRRLDWALSRTQGYVGATGALGTLRGERFAGSSEQMAPVLAAIRSRGLLYIDPRPGAPAPPSVWGRGVDLVLDDPATGPEVDAKLLQLERIARERGSALGLVGAVRPAAMERVEAWANGLAARGFVLAPVSALAQPPGTATGAEQ